MVAVALLAAILTANAPAAGGSGDRWRQYQPDEPYGIYYGVALGPDGRMWFSDGNYSLMLRHLGASRFSSFPIAYAPQQLAVGSDGLFYATIDPFSYGIVRVTPAGATTFIPIADQPYGGLSLGTDGNVWYTATKHVGKVTPSGTVTPYAVTPAHAHGKSYVPYSYGGIAQDAAGRVWFGVRELDGPSYVGSLDPATGITKLYPAGACNPGGGFVLGPDGAIWFQCTGASLARVASGSPIVAYPMPAGLYPDWAQGLAFDSHGRLWTGAEIVQSGIVVGGSFVEFDLATHRFRRHDFPTTQSWPNAIAFSRDGSLWATTLGVPDIVELVR